MTVATLADLAAQAAGLRWELAFDEATGEMRVVGRSKDPRYPEFYDTVAAWDSHTWAETGREGVDIVAAKYIVAAQPDTVLALLSEVDRLRDALERLDAVARVSRLTPVGEAELQAALDRSYWLLHPDQRPSAIDAAARAEAERRAAEPRQACARYWGSDGTLCATHNGRFASPSATRCARLSATKP